jgi:hypothetical protein
VAASGTTATEGAVPDGAIAENESVEGESFECWDCHGEGGYHDCGEDCCMCLDPEDITRDCPTCGGKGFLP